MADIKTSGSQPNRQSCDEPRERKGPTGPSGPTGPTGPCCTGPTGHTGPGTPPLFVEDQSLTSVVLPQNSTTEVLACPPITAPVGSLVVIDALINYRVVNNTTGETSVFVQLLEDGNPLTNSTATPGRITTAPNVFEMNAPIPLAWHLTGDGLPHVYSVEVTTLPTTDGVQTASRITILVNVI